MAVQQNMNKTQALAEANRCLHCYDSPCRKGCPANVNVPAFIRRIATEDFAGASEVITRDNPLGLLCAYVCPAEQLCMRECSSKAIADGIRIPALQAYAMGCSSGRRTDRSPVPTGKRVAVAGAGPSGLTAAYFLAEYGYRVELFEKMDRAGGVPLAQIPGFRLDGAAAAAEAQSLLANNITLHTGAAVDAARAKDLLASFDAVYLATGLGEPVRSLDMNTPGCLYAEDFLERCNMGAVKAGDIGDDIVVIGGGNTAMDAASAAKQLGAARVTVLYRRSQSEMLAWEREYTQALDAGVAFNWHTQVTDLEVVGGKLAAVQAAPTFAEGKDTAGRDVMKADASKARPVAATSLISALGRGANRASAELFGLDLAADGHVKTDEALCTSNPKVFAGGDLVNGGSTVVQAVADGKKAAAMIHRLLSGG